MRKITLFLFLLILVQAASAQSTILEPSLFHQSRSGLANAFAVFKTGKGRVAFMGGSITEANGWRDSVTAYLRNLFPKTAFEFINAGISSTGSTPGAFRLSKDVLSYGKIDLLFEEAAVNDPTNGFFGKYQLRGMEGIVRQALISNPKMDIVLMYCAEPANINVYYQLMTPEVIVQHERVAEHYGINSINLSKEVAARIHDGEFSWEKDFKDLHPSPFGHGVYARSIQAFLKEAFDTRKKAAHKTLPKPLDPYSYFNGHYVSIQQAKLIQGFTYSADWVPNDHAPTRKQYVHVPVLNGEQINDELTLSFFGKAIGICVTSGPDAGILEYSIDGKPFRKIDLYTKWSKSLHLPWYLVLEDELPNTKHQIRMKISSEKHPQSVGHAVRIQQFLVNGK